MQIVHFDSKNNVDIKFNVHSEVLEKPKKAK